MANALDVSSLPKNMLAQADPGTKPLSCLLTSFAQDIRRPVYLSDSLAGNKDQMKAWAQPDYTSDLGTHVPTLQR